MDEPACGSETSTGDTYYKTTPSISDTSCDGLFLEGRVGRKSYLASQQ